MAHLYVVARGINDKLDRWEKDMSAQYLPFKFKDPKDGKKKQGSIRLSMRPIRLYEIAYPEDKEEELLKMIWPQGKEGYKKYHWLSKLKNKFAKLIPGLRSLPKKWPKAEYLRVIREAVGVHGIGIKKDKYKDGIECI